MRLFRFGAVIAAGLLAAVIAAVACGGEAEVVEKVVTVEVERVIDRPGETIVQTVVVEKVVQPETVTEVHTVVVEKPVTVTEKVVETVLVEKQVEGKTVTVVETVVVEKQVTRTEKVVETVVVEKVVEKEVIVKEEVIKEVEKVVVATPSLFEALEIASAADGRRGGTLRVVSQASIGNIDPISSSAGVAWAVSSQIYDVPFAADGSFQPQLQMLEDWSISDDGLVWSFTIRDGLMWHDGDPVTAEDFKATLERAFDSYYTGWQELGSRAEVGVVDDKTWTLNFEAPFGLVLDSLSFNTEGFPIQKKSVIEDTPAERGGGVLQEHIGSGPYQFTSWDVGNKLILERFDGYVSRSEAPSGHAGAKYAFVDSIEFLEIPDVQTRLSLLETREVDFIDTAPLDFFEIMRDNPEINVYTDPIGRWPVMVINHRGPFMDVKVRKALQAAIPNEAIMAAYGPPGLRGLCPAVFLCGLRWDTRVGEENYNQGDVEKAKALLAESSYNNETIRAMTPADQPTIHPILTVAEENLRAAGFNLDLQVVDWATLKSRRVKPDDWDLFTTWGAAAAATPLTNKLGVDGLGGFQSERITAAREAFFEATSEEEQRMLIEELQLAYYDEVPHVVIGFFSGIHAAGTWVRGFDSRALWPAYWNVWLER